MILIILLIGLPGALVILDFLSHIFAGRHFVNRALFKAVEICSIVLIPTLYLSFSDTGITLDCCSESILFSPDHRLSIYVLIILCIVAYGISSIKDQIQSPIIELLTNCFLITGVILNIFIAAHLKEFLLLLLGNAPIILLFLLALKKNHTLFLHSVIEEDKHSRTFFESFCWKILNLEIYKKVPALIILSLPLLILLASFLLIFGQKPDSMIRAFTDTFYHGLSQLDYICENIDCGGHYLCTIAAKGHKGFVKPERIGLRNDKKIVCNRQLLISNAFEELLQQKFPVVHRRIRTFYDLIGNYLNKYYRVFNNKYVSDLIYILMKPLEWFFIIILYTFDKKPENRIAKQYIGKNHRKELNKIVK
jgi:hypothetical protein